MGFQALKHPELLLKCRGDAYNRGLQQGQRYQKQIALTFNAFFQSEMFQILKTQWLPQELSIKWSSFKARMAHAKKLKSQAPDIYEFFVGLAEGSGRPISQFLLFASIDELLAHTPYQLGACTSLAVPPQFSSTQEPFMIKNFDYPYFLRHASIVRQSEPESGLRSLELTLAPFAGCHAGLNEAGVAIAYHSAHHQDKTPFWFPTGLRIQQALQECSSASEVVEFFKSKKQSGGAILSVQDPGGDLFSIELSANQVAVKKINNTISISANHYQNPVMDPFDIPSNAYYTYKKNITELAGKRIKESSETRFDRLFALTGTKIQFHDTDLKTYFKDHDREGYASDNTICRHGEYYETTASVLFHPSKRQIEVAMGAPCETNYTAFQLL